MIFKKCIQCNKNLLFSKKKYLFEQIYCEKCYYNKLETEERKKERKKEIILKKIEEKKNKNLLADLKLKEELKKEELKKYNQIKKLQPKKIQILTKKQDKKIDNYPKRKKQKKKDEIDLELIKKYNKLLYIKANIKNIKVIEYINGKRRISLNKIREIRRTHAGGFSQEKFQKFVEAKKNKTNEWIIELLLRPGVLKMPYELIIIDAETQIKETIKLNLLKINNNQEIK
jgi:hypothetical protein